MKTRNPKTDLIRGALWTVGTRWVIKALGFVNTIVMARLLLPEDYGVVAMGMLAINLIQTFIDFGAATALLRKAETTEAEVHSAWTLRLMQGVLAGILVVVSVPLASAFYNEPRVADVLLTLAGCVVLAGAGSIGPTLAQKAFNFALDFKIQAAAKVASVIATIVAGMILRDYRALIIGIGTSYLVPVFLGYLWHPYRPRWNTEHIQEIWDVTKWLLVAGIGRFVLQRADQFAAGNIANTRDFGLYNVGADIGQLPVGEVGPAMLRALLPVLSTMQADAKRTEYAVIKTIAVINTVIWPIGMGFLALSSQFVYLLLGSKWAGAETYAAAFSLIAILGSSVTPARTLLTLRGFTREQNQLVWIEFFTFGAVALLLVVAFDLALLGLVIARIFAGISALAVTLLFTRRLCNLNAWSAIRHVARPMAGSVMMALLVNFVAQSVAGTLVQVAVGVATGTIFYTAWSLATWHAGGRPEGLESTVIDRLTEYRSSRKGK